MNNNVHVPPGQGSFLLGTECASAAYRRDVGKQRFSVPVAAFENYPVRKRHVGKSFTKWGKIFAHLGFG